MHPNANRTAKLSAPGENKLQPDPTHPIRGKFAQGVPGAKGNVRVLRVWRRSQTNTNIQYKTETLCQAAVIRDISRYGAGLTGSFEVVRKDFVTIQFADGRSIPARVRWHRGVFCGVSFLEPLPAGDPLLAGQGDIATSRQGRIAPAPIASAPTERYAWARQISRQLGLLLMFAGQIASRCLLSSRSPKFTGQGHGTSSREAEMFARACRKQGFAWLIEE